MLRKNYVSLLAILGVAIVVVLIAPMVAQTMGLAMGIASVTPVFAETTSANSNVPVGHFYRGEGSDRENGANMRPAVFGTVSAVNGNMITVTSKLRFRRSGNNATTTAATTATYTVDASKATVTKNGASSSVANITVGDMIMVQGTVSGTNVTATAIRDNVVQRDFQRTQPNPIIQGNGQPIVSGSVTAINGNTITITNKSNVTYTIDASGATVQSGNSTSTLSSIVTGDNVIVQGAVNGTSVTASSIIVQGKPANTASEDSSRP